MWFFLSLLVILVSFEFINVIIIGTFWFLLGMWCFCVSMFLCFLCFSCQKPVKKNCGIPVLLNVLQAANNFSKVSLNFNKILNYVRQVLQTYSAYAFFCLLQKKKSSRSSWQRLISKCHGNLVMKLMTMWRNSYYSKFRSEIWR